MNKKFTLSTSLSLILTVVCLGLASRTQAEQIYGITDATQLFSFDSGSPGTISSLTAITGITPGQSLVAIDFRPANSQLYGLSYAQSGASQLYTINLISGVATPVGSGLTLSANNPGARFSFDFNPAVDRIRVIGGDDSNVRLDPNTGLLAGTDTNVAYAAGDVGAGRNPLLAGAAYTNNVAGGNPTTLYAYDFARGVIVTVGGINGSPSPNTGMLFTVNNAGDGTAGINPFSASLGFDISGATGIGYINADNENDASSDNLYTVDLATGVLTLVGAIGAPGPGVLDISVLPVPEPNTIAFLAVGLSVGGVALLRRRRA